MMELKKLEDEALHLSSEDRAKLIHRLVQSLDEPSKEELNMQWLDEAKRRADELDDGNIQTKSIAEVLAKARALVK